MENKSREMTGGRVGTKLITRKCCVVIVFSIFLSSSVFVSPVTEISSVSLCNKTLFCNC